MPNFIVIALILILSIYPSSSYAYIDPGAGSALIQGLIGIAVGAAVALKLYWHRLIKFLGLSKSSTDESKKDS